MSAFTLNDLEARVHERAAASPDVSYTRKLLDRGVAHCAKKLGEEAVEAAIAAFAGDPVRVHCAGRTDAGVHASHQVVHLDLARDWRTDTVRDATNAHLRPAHVAILAAQIVGNGRPDVRARLKEWRAARTAEALASKVP